MMRHALRVARPSGDGGDRYSGDGPGPVPAPSPDGVLPEAILRLAGPAVVVVELAAGRRFDLALDLARRGARVRVSDRDPGVLAAPAPLEAFVDDLHAPDLARYAGASLLVARRLPEELQAAAARLARHLGVPLAFRPLKDELGDVGPHRLVEGWRVVEP